MRIILHILILFVSKFSFGQTDTSDIQVRSGKLGYFIDGVKVDSATHQNRSAKATQIKKRGSDWPKAEYAFRGPVMGLLVSEYPAIDFGFSYARVGEFHWWGVSFSVEQYFRNEYKIAPKIRAYFDFLFVLGGISVPWYFDMDGNNAPRLRLEVGYGDPAIQIYYCPNINITRDNLKNISIHNITISYNLNGN